MKQGVLALAVALMAACGVPADHRCAEACHEVAATETERSIIDDRRDMAYDDMLALQERSWNRQDELSDQVETLEQEVQTFTEWLEEDNTCLARFAGFHLRGEQ